MAAAVSTTIRPCSPARACRLRAWDRAKVAQLIPYRNDDGTWSVKTYSVRVTGAGWSALSCNCPAGRVLLTNSPAHAAMEGVL